MKHQALFVAGVVAFAAIFYFWQLGRADVVTDESSYGARAIGLVDFDFGIAQPTPWQWIQTLPPWWMRLSFHDHPPLVFWLQHFFIRLFGETPFAIRVPSVIAGLVAVILVYLIGKRLYSAPAGLISAGLFAFTVNHVWVSRIGLLESPLIALMLASFYCFLRALTAPNPRGERWFIAAGIFIGLAFLAKYLAIILIPIFLAILALTRRDLWRSKHFIFSIFLFLVISSPVIIYNIQLYRNFGHFDFQLSMLFSQETPHWPTRPAQEALGSLTNRLRLFPDTLSGSNSPLFLVLSALGLATILAQAIITRRSSQAARSHWPAPHLSSAHSAGSLVISVALLLFFLIAVGPTIRFLTLLTPWLAIAAGYSLAQFAERLGRLKPAYGYRVIVMVMAIVVSLEALYAYNSIIAPLPVGIQPWAYSSLRNESHSWGFNQLEGYLRELFRGRVPEVAITFEEFPFARETLNRALADGKRRGLEAMPGGIVYDGNVNVSSQLWYFLRHILYRGWPITDAETFRAGGGYEFFRDAGVKKIFFIASTPYALRDRPRGLVPDAEAFEIELRSRGAKPVEIKNLRGEVAFRVYQFELQ